MSIPKRYFIWFFSAPAALEREIVVHIFGFSDLHIFKVGEPDTDGVTGL